MMLEERVARLERSNRRWRSSCLLLIALLPAAILPALRAAPPLADLDHLSVRSLAVVDEDGEPGVEISVASGSPYLMMGGGDGERGGLFLRVGEAGSASITAFDGDGRDLLALGIDEEQRASIITSNTDGHELVRIGCDERGHGRVTAARALGDPTLQLAAADDGAGAILVFDRAGKPRLRLAAASDAGSLTITDGTDARCVEVTSDEHGGIVRVRDPRGRRTSAAIETTESAESVPAPPPTTDPSSAAGG